MCAQLFLQLSVPACAEFSLRGGATSNAAKHGMRHLGRTHDMNEQGRVGVLSSEAFFFTFIFLFSQTRLGGNTLKSHLSQAQKDIG